MIQAVLCDIDGTLVDSNWLHAAAWKDAFEVAGFNLELESIRQQIGKGGDELIPVFVPEIKRGVIDAPLTKFRKYIYQKDYLPQVKPFPNVRELMLLLKSIEIRIALASSADSDELDIYKKITNIEDLVEKSTSAQDADRSKPHPDIFEAALRKLNLSPEQALALGDTPYDAEAAGKAHVPTVGVTSGGWSEKDLRAAGCIAVYQDVNDLLANFEESPFARGV